MSKIRLSRSSAGRIHLILSLTSPPRLGKNFLEISVGAVAGFSLSAKDESRLLEALKSRGLARMVTIESPMIQKLSIATEPAKLEIDSTGRLVKEPTQNQVCDLSWPFCHMLTPGSASRTSHNSIGRMRRAMIFSLPEIRKSFAPLRSLHRRLPPRTSLSLVPITGRKARNATTLNARFHLRKPLLGLVRQTSHRLTASCCSTQLSAQATTTSPNSPMRKALCLDPGISGEPVRRRASLVGSRSNRLPTELFFFPLVSPAEGLGRWFWTPTMKYLRRRS
ncbi:hypothetical protein LXA43DRAFT_327017 [Ganoderma leucocontextum]|nr:hypothetical protein LXA43DRAFT_327017 [Ganoderma leucocontextum]